MGRTIACPNAAEPVQNLSVKLKPLQGRLEEMRTLNYLEEKKGRTSVRLLTALCVCAWCALPKPGAAAQKPPTTYTIPMPSQADFSDIKWLLGEWSGKTAGKTAQGGVLLSASYALGKRIVILRGQLALPATKTAPAISEGFMGIVSGRPSAKTYDMALYSSTGFVIRYRVSAKNGKIDFSPQGGLNPPPGWLFRRSIQRTAPDRCIESVDVAPPGQPFFNYYTANLNRVKPGEHPTQPPTPTQRKRRKLLFWHRGE